MKRLEVLFFALGAALFLLLLRRFGLTSLLDSLTGQGPRFFLILIPTAVSYLLFCFAWWLTLEPAERSELSFPYLFLVSMAGFSLNYITPFIALGGEPLKMVILSRKLGRMRGVSSVLAYNALHVLSHLFVFMAACLLGFWVMEPSPTRAGGLIGGLLVSASLAAVLLTCHERGLAEQVFRVLRRLRLLRAGGATQEQWQERLQRYDESVRSFYRTRGRDFWLALTADFFGRSIWTYEVVLMFRNLGQALDPWRAYFVHSINSMMMVPTFFVPYELGVKEGAFCLCLKWLGLDPSLGIYVGVASRVREIIWIAVGLVIMASLGVKGIPSLARQTSVPKEGG